MARGSGDILQLLANPTNRAILSILAVEPQYPRRLAEVVGLTEDEASRRLRAFEKLGIAEADWANVGKTVRLYRLASKSITVDFTASGLLIDGLGESAPMELGAVGESAPVLQRFVGRARELADVHALLSSRRAVCVHGLGGVGKTSLAAKAAEGEARPVVWHTLAPGESGTLLLSRLSNAMRSIVRGDAAKKLLALRTSDDGALLADAIAQLANEHRTLLVLDRFEGASEGAGDVVARLAQRLLDGRMLLTARAFPADVPRDLVASYRLEGLAIHDSARLLAELSSAPVGEDAARALYGRTSGHPLALVLLALAGGPPTTERLAEEEGIRSFLMSDVLPQLPETERDVLLSLSVFREAFLADEAEAVCERKHVRDALLRLEARGLVLRAGQTFAIHELVRTFAAEAAPNAKALHARAAKVLLASGESGKALAALEHLLDAGDTARAGALVRSELLGRAHRFYDEGHAARYHRLVERLSAMPQLKGADRIAVAIELSLFATSMGDAPASQARIDEAARLGPAPELDAPLVVARARLLHLQGRMKEAAAAYAEAGAKARDDGMRLRCLVDQAFCSEEWSDDEALALYERAMGMTTSDLRMLSLSYAGAARVGARRGHPATNERSEEALRLARISGSARGEAAVYMTLTSHAMAIGDFAGGIKHAERYLQISDLLGDPWLKACALVDVAFLLVGSGQLDAAEATAVRAIEHSRSISNTYYALSGAIALAEARLARGDALGASGALHPTLDEAPPAWPAMLARGWLVDARASAALGRKEAAEASHAKARALDPAGDPGTIRSIRTPGGLNP